MTAENNDLSPCDAPCGKKALTQYFAEFFTNLFDKKGVSTAG